MIINYADKTGNSNIVAAGCAAQKLFEHEYTQMGEAHQKLCLFQLSDCIKNGDREVVIYPIEIKRLHLEVSSHCNASCLGCARTSDMSPLAEAPLEPENLPLEFYLRLMGDRRLGSLKKMYFCGVMGDPLASPFLLEILDVAFNSFPDLDVVIHTNGSLGSGKVWENLGHYSRDFNLTVHFSIDGLEDTNSLYRIGVPWDKVMKNANVYIASGGEAVWKFIKFPYNEYQIPEAKALSRKMGFSQFEVRKNYEPGRVYPEFKLEDARRMKISSSAFSGLDNERLYQEMSHIDFKFDGQIECEALQGSELYVDASGRVWPCCWVGNLGIPRVSFPDREVFRRNFLDGEREDFNSLRKNTLSEILASDFFQRKIPKAWDKENRGKSCFNPACEKHCRKQ